MIRYAVAGKRSFRKGSGLTYKKPSSGVLFLYVSAPSQTEVKKISRDFSLGKDVLTLYKKEGFSRILSLKPFQFVIRDYFVEKQSVKRARLLFVVRDNVFIIVSDGRTKYYTALFNKIADDMKDNRVKTVPHMLQSYLLQDIEDNYDVLETTEEHITELEAQAAKGNGKVSLNKIIALKKNLFKMSRQFQASAKILSTMRRQSTVHMDKKTADGFAELHDMFLHQIDVVATQKEMVSDVISVYSTNISNKLNTASNELNIRMKRITSYALIIMIPTLITGIYGMNFRFLPLADHPQGFLIMIILMAISAVLLVKELGQRDWL